MGERLLVVARVPCVKRVHSSRGAHLTPERHPQAQLLGDGLMHFRGLVASPDGQKIFRVERSGAPADFIKMGRDAGEEVRLEAGEAFFEELQRYVQNVQAANTKPTKVTK